MNEHYPFVLPPLPYRYYALEPYLEEQTIRIHHDTLFQGYVDRLNAALQKYPRFQRWNLERLIVDNDRLPVEIRTTVYNNAGGVYNHDAYFAAMTPKYRRPSNYMRNVLEESFGSFENFKEQMLNAGLRVFGSGWACWYKIAVLNCVSLQQRIRIRRCHRDLYHCCRWMSGSIPTFCNITVNALPISKTGSR